MVVDVVVVSSVVVVVSSVVVVVVLQEPEIHSKELFVSHSSLDIQFAYNPPQE